MNIYSYELRAKAVKAYLEGNSSLREVANDFNISPSALHDWVNRYKLHGEAVFEHYHQTHSGDFKLHVLKYMYDNHTSMAETARIFGCFSVTSLRQWHEVYMKKGEEGILAMNPHISSMKTRTTRVNSKNVTSLSKEELLRENERLRMENEYLKKLQALVQERICRENGNVPPSSMN